MKTIPQKTQKVTYIDTIILDENGKDTQEQNTSHKGTDIDTLSVEDEDDVREKKAQRVLTKSKSRTDETLATNLQHENFSQQTKYIQNMLKQMATDKMKSVSSYLAMQYKARLFSAILL